MELLSDIHESGTAILLVTHDAKVAARAERVLFMKDGKIVSETQQHENQSISRRTEEITKKMLEVEI